MRRDPGLLSGEMRERERDLFLFSFPLPVRKQGCQVRLVAEGLACIGSCVLSSKASIAHFFFSILLPLSLSGVKIGALRDVATLSESAFME